MKEEIICFALGLSPEDIEKGKASLYSLNQGAYLLEVIPVSDSMLPMIVADGLERATAGTRQFGEKALPPGLVPCRVMVVDTREREQVVQIMRGFKAVLSDPQDLIFAVITETVLSWTFGEYIGHLLQEHEHMKTRNSGK